MKIKNLTGEARQIPTGELVDAGETVELEDDALGKSLAEQTDVWQIVTTKTKGN